MSVHPGLASGDPTLKLSRISVLGAEGGGGGGWIRRNICP